MNKIDESIFKAYDIRGIYPAQLDEKLAYKIGRGYATFILKENSKARNIVVGSDMRVSSPALKKELIRGFVDSGLDVVDVGLVSTPTFYFAVSFYNYDGGIQVSASHNPKEYNGFKIVRERAFPIGKNTGIFAIRDIILKDEFIKSEKKGRIIEKDNILRDFIGNQLSNIDVSKIKKFKIVVDAANSMGALDIEEFFKKVPVELIKINFELDGTFPSHEADPLKEENLKLLKQKVIETGADFGISSDGDGDRYFFVDEKGNSLRQEILRGIMAQIELADNYGATVCYDIRPGRITKDMIEEMGGKSIVTPVGHSLIKEIMIKNDAVFGGESSGHYFYKKNYGTFEMPAILIAKFLKFLSEKNMVFSEVVKPYQKYFHSGEINFRVKSVAEKLKEIEEKYSDGKIIKIDGVTVEYSDWWFNVRGSNTEPVIRLNLEAKTNELMKEKTE
ncbi:MAG: phosphomannomutase/phosphoglucomutase, partial [Candidatus Pacebacteria bacterium]|nr:phosphomannomutase/phosphoglucomutase [Candidatus Paceibacterota bacterium]